MSYNFKQIPDATPATKGHPLNQRFAWPDIAPENLRAERFSKCFVWFTEEVIRLNAHAELPTSEEIEEAFLEKITDIGLNALELMELRLQTHRRLKWFATADAQGRCFEPSEFVFAWEEERNLIPPLTATRQKGTQSRKETVKLLQEIAASAKRRHEKADKGLNQGDQCPQRSQSM